jgi:hypothetical protein
LLVEVVEANTQVQVVVVLVAIAQAQGHLVQTLALSQFLHLTLLLITP